MLFIHLINVSSVRQRSEHCLSAVDVHLSSWICPIFDLHAVFAQDFSKTKRTDVIFVSLFYFYCNSVYERKLHLDHSMMQ